MAIKNMISFSIEATRFARGDNGWEADLNGVSE